MFLKHKIVIIREKVEDVLYFLFRIMVGFFFFLHGAQKTFGWFSEKGPVDLASLMGLAGVVEIIAGLLLIFGLWARIASFFSAIQMLVAYFMMHAPQNLVPLLNRGELALLYFAAFLVLIIHGSGKASLDQLFAK